MKTCLLLLISLSGLAQDSERLLKETAEFLYINRMVTKPSFWSRPLPDSIQATAEAYQQQAGQFTTNRDFGKAFAVWEKIAQIDPKKWGQLGYTFLNQWHDYPRAIRCFDAYDALTPKFDDIYANNPVSYLRGIAYQKAGNHEKAIEQMSLSIDLIDLKHGSEWVNYRYFINRAVSYLATQQPEKALADLDKAVRNFTHGALAQYYRGKALLALNRRAEAKTAFQDASFFLKALRVELSNEREDEYNPVCEEQIDDALAELK